MALPGGVLFSMGICNEIFTFRFRLTLDMVIGWNIFEQVNVDPMQWGIRPLFYSRQPRLAFFLFTTGWTVFSLEFAMEYPPGDPASLLTWWFEGAPLSWSEWTRCK